MKDYDCTTCVKRLTCAGAQEGMFCAEYASKLPKPNRKEPSMWDGSEDD